MTKKIKLDANNRWVEVDDGPAGILPREHGGWGLSTHDWPAGSVPYISPAGGEWTGLRGINTGQPLVWNAIFNSPAFGAIDVGVAGHVNGILPPSNGGWGVSTQDWPPGALPLRDGFGTDWTYITGTTNGQPLVWQAFSNSAAFAALNLTAAANTSGILPEARGGTGQARGAAPSVTLAFPNHNVTLNLTSNMATVLTAQAAGTTNLTFTGASTARTRISYLVCVGTSSGRVLNWPTGVTVYPPYGSDPESSYTIPAGVRTVVQLLQVASNTFYRLTG